MSFTIRTAVPGDADAVAELCNGLARHTGEAGDKMTGQRVVADFLAPGSGLDLFVADRAGDVVGYALYNVAYETAFAAKGLYLSDLFVAPEARRLGIATALIAAVADMARQRGGEFVWWVEKNDSPAAKTLYARLANLSVPVTAFAATDASFKELSARHRQES